MMLWFLSAAAAHAGKTQRRLVSAWIGTTFAEAGAPAAHAQGRRVAGQLRSRVPRLAELMDAAEHDVLGYMDFPRGHHAKIHSTDPAERLNGGTKRRTDVVGISPSEGAITRLISSFLPEHPGEWATQRTRYMTLETIGSVSTIQPSACPPWPPDTAAHPAKEYFSYTTPQGAIPSSPV